MFKEQGGIYLRNLRGGKKRAKDSSVWKTDKVRLRPVEPHQTMERVDGE